MMQAQQKTRPRFGLIPTSPFKDVSNEAWHVFSHALECRPLGFVSPTGALGAFEMHPRRLMELGYLTDLKRLGCNGEKQAGEFVLPWTQKRFLEDPYAQYVAFRKSILLYYRALMSGELKRPEGVSMAGALAILHRGGKGALKEWPVLFEETKKLYDRVKDAF